MQNREPWKGIKSDPIIDGSMLEGLDIGMISCSWSTRHPSLFSKRLKLLARSYENGEVLQAVRTAALNRNTFWHLVNRYRKSKAGGSLAIRHGDGKVVHEVLDVLETLKVHFSKLGTPKTSHEFMCLVANRIRINKYIPQCFRIGVQIRLFKGKGLPIWDPNSCCRNTLLSTFNKLFEVLLLQRLKGWWIQDEVISGI